MNEEEKELRQKWEKEFDSDLAFNDYDLSNGNDDSINLTDSEKKRRLKLQEEEARKALEDAKLMRQLEDMEAVLHAAAGIVNTEEQQGKVIDPDERELMILKEALALIGTHAVKHPHNANIKEGIVELDTHIRGRK